MGALAWAVAMSAGTEGGRGNGGRGERVRAHRQGGGGAAASSSGAQAAHLLRRRSAPGPRRPPVRSGPRAGRAAWLGGWVGTRDGPLRGCGRHTVARAVDVVQRRGAESHENCRRPRRARWRGRTCGVGDRAARRAFSRGHPPLLHPVIPRDASRQQNCSVWGVGVRQEAYRAARQPAGSSSSARYRRWRQHCCAWRGGGDGGGGSRRSGGGRSGQRGRRGGGRDAGLGDGKHLG